MKPLDFGWLVGLIEGEGTFAKMLANKGHGKIALTMTDGDVMARAARLFGRKLQGPFRRPSAPKTRKPKYTVEIAGEPGRRWARCLYKHLGARRRAQIANVWYGGTRVR